MKYLISLWILLLSATSFALDAQEWPDIEEGIVSIKIKEPLQQVKENTKVKIWVLF